MSKTRIHIINHTHWDREWFLTSVYTTHWVPTLIDRLTELVAANPDFKYFFDGQTLVAEDLLEAYPDYKDKLEALLRSGNLTIGPYYCQPDWQLTNGESLMRNLEYGLEDVATLGGNNDIKTGWLVDTFGHISQNPQIHRSFGIDAVYVWRGMPELEPFFDWQSSSGHCVLGINLFGGYRNLYGISHVPEVAKTRLDAEVTKLESYYPMGDIPLFDGYDLEDNPEDPLKFFKDHVFKTKTEIDELAIELNESTPDSFVDAVKSNLGVLPIIQDELNSGKFGATFPGTFSARTYLKVMSYDASYMLYSVCEPLAVLAAVKGGSYNENLFNRLSRVLLQNAVHDCICGVSIDQAHEKMEDNYRKVFDAAQKEINTSTQVIMQDFAAGNYALSTNPFPYQGFTVLGDQVYEANTQGIGVWPLAKPQALHTTQENAEFDFSNLGFEQALKLLPTGELELNGAILGRIEVFAEHGDTYSDETGERLGVMKPVGNIKLEQSSPLHKVIRYECAFNQNDLSLKATVRLMIDKSSLLRWQIDLDSKGTDFRLDMVFETGLKGRIFAGMPFDQVERVDEDRDLLPKGLSEDMAKILLGQRELGRVKSFPFHDYVSLTNEQETASVFAKGTHSYCAKAGRLAITLRRSVEWLTKADLEHRIGDAGPFFYVPDARCERTIRHEIAFVRGDFRVDDIRLQQHHASFKYAPLVLTKIGEGQETSWSFLQQNVPLSSMRIKKGEIQTRWFNPTLKEQADLKPKEIRSQSLALKVRTGSSKVNQKIELFQQAWRVGENQGQPDRKIIEKLKQQIKSEQETLEKVKEAHDAAQGNERHVLQHKIYILDREIHEYLLSVRLNELKLSMTDREQYLYERDPEVTNIGWKLNQLRIKRRIYDYVVTAI